MKRKYDVLWKSVFEKCSAFCKYKVLTEAIIQVAETNWKILGIQKYSLFKLLWNLSLALESFRMQWFNSNGTGNVLQFCL